MLSLHFWEGFRWAQAGFYSKVPSAAGWKELEEHCKSWRGERRRVLVAVGGRLWRGTKASGGAEHLSFLFSLLCFNLEKPFSVQEESEQA